MRSDFLAPWWLRNAHAQTVWGRLARARRLVAFRREIITTPDGDELVLDHLDEPPHAREPLHFLLMHGLEGSSYSVYIQGVLSVIARHGFTATAINFRSCARDPQNLSRMLPNRRPRFYHSGDTGDFDFVARMLAARMPRVPLVAFGASLGGNALLKWLGENPGQQIVAAAAALSAPYDLGAGAAYLERGLGWLYVSRFLATLNRKVVAVAEKFPEIRSILDVQATLRSRTFREFDDAATAPLHGFRDADHYYEASSSIRFIGRITTPTLAISAEDDPFLPPSALAAVRQAASPHVDLRITANGGHTGFVAGLPWRCNYWAEETTVAWLIGRAFEDAEVTPISAVSSATRSEQSERSRSGRAAR